MSNKDKHYNNHRKDKVTFQALLLTNEAQLISKVKSLRKFKTGRELLVTLCQEELNRKG
ncbi:MULTISPECIES: hypothetical protein [Zooshikella]|uniref:hypothetical protein n=1 Tax=Zooshikella TaxID=202771 RepID=UPI0004128B43|nr:hypothetical protein [Zooshikella ganghwensis]MBU2708492.1 hypothetical protein [Zooshikella ganghwensis]